MRKKLFIVSMVLITFTSILFADAASDKRNKFISAAKSYLGIPYVYGGTSRSGLDCSGFVMNAARDVGISLPRTAAQMFSYATIISDSERQPGDLIFFRDGSNVSHVAIYLGNNKVIHCVSDGPHTGVIQSDLSERYWAAHYYKPGRIITSSTAMKDTSTTTTTTSTPTSTPTSTSKPKTSSSKRRKSADFYVNFNGYFDWNFFTPTRFGFLPKGGSLQTEFQLNLWNINPGLMVRFTYPIQYDQEFSMKNMFNCFELPICLTLHINDYIAFYTGPVLSTDIVCKEPLSLIDTEKKIAVPVYGIIGASFQTPKIDLGGCQLSFVQDISYTFFMAYQGYDKLTFKENLAAGITFSTGVSVSLPF
ncbi:MAG: C40 family peptidase [Treponema sp.]|nr:C40 family peptidase [Treponema sp.]